MKNIYREKYEGEGERCPFCFWLIDEKPYIQKYKDWLLILNEYPYTPYHMLVIPLKHQCSWDLSGYTNYSAKGLLTKYAGKMMKRLGFEGYIILEREGTVSRKSVSHVHTHIIPVTKKNDISFNFAEILTPIDLVTMNAEVKEITNRDRYKRVIGKKP